MRRWYGTISITIDENIGLAGEGNFVAGIFSIANNSSVNLIVVIQLEYEGRSK